MSPAPLTEFSLEEEYGKKTGVTREDIVKLRQWVDTQPHLPAEVITELDLILTFHCCDRSAEVSKQVLDLHFTLKTLFNNFFKDRAVDNKLLKTLDVILPLACEGRTREGYAVFYGRLIDYDAKYFVFHEIIRAAFMVLDLWQFEEGTWPGLSIILDLEEMNLGHLARLDIQTLQQFLYFVQEALLLRLKSIHFMNAPSFMDRLMMLIRPFLKKELLEILHIHQVGTKTIDKFVPMEVLPKSDGGKFNGFGRFRDDLITKLKANKEFFVEENKKRVVESRRPGKPKTISDIFGSVEGSFKKLDID